MIEHIRNSLQEAQRALEAFLANEQTLGNIQKAAELLIASFEHKGKAFSCGNGGSMCDAMHFAEELSGRYRGERRSLAAIAISDTSHLSCVGNDYGFEFVFSRFLEGLGNEGDVLLGISTSGNSPNVVRAVEAAREKVMKVVLLTGRNGGKLAGTADVEVRVPHMGYADRVQEVHIKIIHLFILLIEKLVIGI